MGKPDPGCRDYQSMILGYANGEPLLHILDGLLRYAKAYRVRFDGPLENDYVLGPAWLDTAKGVRALLNGDGAVAMERGITTDSKCNGVLEDIFWAAIKAAGFEEGDV